MWATSAASVEPPGRSSTESQPGGSTPRRAALATGEAIGTAAALAVDAGGDLESVDPARVREAITKHFGEKLP